MAEFPRQLHGWKGPFRPQVAHAQLVGLGNPSRWTRLARVSVDWSWLEEHRSVMRTPAGKSEKTTLVRIITKLGVHIKAPYTVLEGVFDSFLFWFPARDGCRCINYLRKTCSHKFSRTTWQTNCSGRGWELSHTSRALGNWSILTQCPPTTGKSATPASQDLGSLQ